MFNYKTITFTLALFTVFNCINAQNTGDTVTINFSNSKMLIISAEEEDEWDFEAEEQAESDKKEKKLKLKSELLLGTNGYLSSINSIALPEEFSNMRVNYSRSRGLTYNLMLKGFATKNKRLYISPGIGLSRNNYVFENPIRIQNQNDSTVFALDTITNFKKYRLSNTYVQLPLVVGIRIGDLKKRTLGIQLGIIGGYKINSKVINHYENNGTSYKSKEFNSFNLNPFQLSSVVRLSLGKIGLYASYSLTSLFIENSAPPVYPISLGFILGRF